LKILTFLWISFWLFIGVSMLLETPDQIKKDNEFIETEIKPCVEFVKGFKESNDRLPNYREYYTWVRNHYGEYCSDLKLDADSLIGVDCILHKYIRSNFDIINSEDAQKFKDADWSQDFAISQWRGEWTEYYYSWTNEYDTNKYLWKDSIVTFTIMSVIAFLPMVFWWIRKRRMNRQKAVANNTYV